ncbi:hypothetical protein BKA61DRAFT_479224 [Leptodontidium sp. MPI-SDFR-AT-0119]|nr:hypothetical protein BKA61DRAFT_479224 [Leptodontidium sp. MPI-SDFR-AT-0119]
MSRNGEPRSLWNQAYDNLEKDLVEKYNKLLSRELTSAYKIQVIYETVNQISTDPIVRRTQLDEIMERGKKRMENSRSKYTIAGHDFDLKKQLTEAADFVLWGKAFVDQAVKPSAEASLIWAGVGLILPLLTYPHLAAQANESGFNYITTRMDFYVALEPQLLPASISEELKKAFQKDVVDLYQHILEFQFRSVLRFYKNSLKRFARDVRNQKVWDEMLSKVQAAEQTLKDHFEEINIGASTQRLENLDKRAEESLGIMKKLLLVTEQQRDISSNILQQVTLTKYATLSHSHLFRLTPQ